MSLLLTRVTALAQTTPAPAASPPAAPVAAGPAAKQPATPPAASEEEQPRLSDRAELDRIIELYMAGDYTICSADLSLLLDPANPDKFKDRSIIEKGRLYYASCALLDGHRTKARRALRDALEENPLMPSPDSLTFPPPVVSLFLEVRDEVQQLITEREKEQLIQLRREAELARRRAEQRENREKLLEQMAREEVVVSKNSRYLASIPFGVGQYQNGKTALGTLFLVSETLLVATAATSGFILADMTAKAAESGGVVTDPDRYNKQKHAAHTTMTVTSWTFLAVAGIGILEAHLNFKPEKKLLTRERQLPPEVEDEARPEDAGASGDFSWAPTLSFGQAGAEVGIVGSF